APVEPPVALSETKRIEGPIRTAGLHDIQMREKENRLASLQTVKPHHEVAFFRDRREYFHVVRRESGIAKPLRHRVGRLGHIAAGIGGVNFYELFQDVPGRLMLR